MRLIRNRPAHPSMSPTNPSTHRAEALRAAVPDPCAAAAQQHDPALGGRHEGLGEKCGLGGVNGGAKTGHVAVQNQAIGGAPSAMARALPT
jgi:hypothetical protein